MLLAVPQAAVPCGELVQAPPQVLLIGNKGPPVPLRGTVLAEDGAGSSLRGPETTLDAADRAAATLGA